MTTSSRIPVAAVICATIAMLSACDEERPPDDQDTSSCIPETCVSLGRECGTISDGCGSLVSCGSCDDGFQCKQGTCREICMPDCRDQCGGESNCPGVYCTDNCAMTGRECVDDGADMTCRGDCVPRTCRSLGVECSTWDDWCGNTVDCGACLPGSECVGGVCTEAPADGLGYNCEAGAGICPSTFPECVKLTGESSFCTRTCTGDSQCGTGNCCAPILGDVSYCVPGGNQYMCDNPVGTTACFNGETCLPSPDGACLFCFPEGTTAAGSECDGFNSCVSGQACVRLAGEAKSTCRELCNPENQDSCAGAETTRHCEAVEELGDYGVCVDGAAGCNPLKLGTDCPTDWNCVPALAACTSFQCASTGGQKIGESCSKFADCARGGYCADGVCRQLCAAAAPCPEYYQCVQGCSTKVRYCAPAGGQTCNPAATTNDCLSGQACLPDSTANCTTGTCVQHGKSLAGTACTTHSDCVAGTMCYDNTCQTTCTLTKTCALPSYCQFVCTSVDLGICLDI